MGIRKYEGTHGLKLQFVNNVKKKKKCYKAIKLHGKLHLEIIPQTMFWTDSDNTNLLCIICVM